MSSKACCGVVVVVGVDVGRVCTHEISACGKTAPHLIYLKVCGNRQQHKLSMKRRMTDPKSIEIIRSHVQATGEYNSSPVAIFSLCRPYIDHFPVGGSGDEARRAGCYEVGDCGRHRTIQYHAARFHSRFTD